MVTLRLTDRPVRGGIIQPAEIAQLLQIKRYYSVYPRENWIPSVNLYETDSAYLVCVDLAGVDKQKINIQIKDGRLTIRGSRGMPTAPQLEQTDGAHASDGSGPPREKPRRIKVHLMEIDHGGFARDVELPNDVASEGITARHDNGLLWIELPKRG